MSGRTLEQEMGNVITLEQKMGNVITLEQEVDDVLQKFSIYENIINGVYDTHEIKTALSHIAARIKMHNRIKATILLCLPMITFIRVYQQEPDRIGYRYYALRYFLVYTRESARLINASTASVVVGLISYGLYRLLK